MLEPILSLALFGAARGAIALPHFINPPKSLAKRIPLYMARLPGYAFIAASRLLLGLPIYLFLLGFNIHAIMNFLQQQMETSLEERYRETAKRAIRGWKQKRLIAREDAPKPRPCNAPGCHGRCQRRYHGGILRNPVDGWESTVGILALMALPLSSGTGYGWHLLGAWAALQALGLVLARDDRRLFWKTLQLWALATYRPGRLREDATRLAEITEASPETPRYRVAEPGPVEDPQLEALLAIAEEAERQAPGKSTLPAE